MSFFNSKNTEKIFELEGKIAELERRLERSCNIHIGEINHLSFWRDLRPTVGVAHALNLLIAQQGLELRHTYDKIELVKVKKCKA